MAIPLATGSEYSLTAADRGKTITVRTTAKFTGLLDSVSTSLPTAVVGDLMLEGWDDEVYVTLTKEGTPNAPILRVGPTATGIDGPAGLIQTYQWFRGGVAVVGATKATYAITALDRGKDVHVRVITTHAAVSGQTYASNTKTSVPFDHTIRATTAVTGLARLGHDLTLNYALATGAGALTTGFSADYQWLRNGLVIPGATSNYYTLTPADLGKRISVRATFGFAGFLPLTVTVATTPATAVVAAGVLDLGSVHPAIDSENIGRLKLVIPAGITPTPSGYLYQWLRNGVAIPKATASTYTLVAADAARTSPRRSPRCWPAGPRARCRSLTRGIRTSTRSVRWSSRPARRRSARRSRRPCPATRPARSVSPSRSSPTGGCATAW